MATPLRQRAARAAAAARRGWPRRLRTVEAWLVHNGQTPRIRELLWDPLALAALNQPPDSSRARPPSRGSLAEMFGAHASARGDCAAPPSRVHLMYAEQRASTSSSRGGAVRTGAAAKVMVAGDAVAGGAGRR